MPCREFLLQLVKFASITFSYYSFAYTGLPEDPNRKHILSNCLRCHDSTYIKENNMSRSAWDKTIAWMETKHNLNLEDVEVRQKILDYLEKYFSQKKETEIPFIALRRVNPLPE